MAERVCVDCGVVFILKEEETEDDKEATTDDDFVERRVSYQAGERAAERCAKLVPRGQVTLHARVHRAGHDAGRQSGSQVRTGGEVVAEGGGPEGGADEGGEDQHRRHEHLHCTQSVNSVSEAAKTIVCVLSVGLAMGPRMRMPVWYSSLPIDQRGQHKSGSGAESHQWA